MKTVVNFSDKFKIEASIDLDKFHIDLALINEVDIEKSKRLFVFIIML